MRPAVREMVQELRSWLPNYDQGEDEFPSLLYRVLASLPGGEELEDLGYKPFNATWHEMDQLARTIDAIQNRDDVEDLVAGLLSEDDDE